MVMRVVRGDDVLTVILDEKYRHDFDGRVGLPASWSPRSASRYGPDGAPLPEAWPDKHFRLDDVVSQALGLREEMVEIRFHEAKGAGVRMTVRGEMTWKEFWVIDRAPRLVVETLQSHLTMASYVNVFDDEDDDFDG